MATLWSLLAQYGPFPLGIVVGMYITRWSLEQQLKYMQLEKDGLRKEKINQSNIILNYEKRFDALHKKLSDAQILHNSLNLKEKASLSAVGSMEKNAKRRTK